MADVVVFGDVEALVGGWVRARLAGRKVPVVNKVPAQRPPKFVLIQRHGGPGTSLVTDSAQIGVECWGESDAEAHDLAQLVRADLRYALPGQVLDGHTVYRHPRDRDEFAGPANLPDPLSNQSRYVFTVPVLIRGRTV